MSGEIPENPESHDQPGAEIVTLLEDAEQLNLFRSADLVVEYDVEAMTASTWRSEILEPGTIPAGSAKDFTAAMERLDRQHSLLGIAASQARVQRFAESIGKPLSRLNRAEANAVYEAAETEASVIAQGVRFTHIQTGSTDPVTGVTLTASLLRAEDDTTGYQARHLMLEERDESVSSTLIAYDITPTYGNQPHRHAHPEIELLADRASYEDAWNFFNDHPAAEVVLNDVYDTLTRLVAKPGQELPEQLTEMLVQKYYAEYEQPEAGRYMSVLMAAMLAQVEKANVVRANPELQRLAPDDFEQYRSWLDSLRTDR